MPHALRATSAVTATEFAKRFHPNPPPDIIAEEPESAWSAPEQTASDSEPRCHETQTELAHANRVAILGQLLASIAHEVKQPIVATVITHIRQRGSRRQTAQSDLVCPRLEVVHLLMCLSEEGG